MQKMTPNDKKNKNKIACVLTFQVVISEVFFFFTLQTQNECVIITHVHLVP